PGTDRSTYRSAAVARRGGADTEPDRHGAASSVRSASLRVRLHEADAARRRDLTAKLAAFGHEVVDTAPDVELCDLAPGVAAPGEAEAPVIVLTARLP